MGRLLSHTFALLALLVFSNFAIAEEEPFSRYIRKEVGSTNVIVFVHGVLGDSRTTWGNGGVFWPDLLKGDPAFAGTDIYIYGFPTTMWGTLSVDELADVMRRQLDADGVTDHPHIAFLAHSMGGLVTRSYLLKYRDVVPKTSFIYLLSTPTAGSQVASLATLVSRNPQFSKMKPMNADDFLGDVLRQWLSAEFKIPSYCAYEKRPTYGLMIVDFQSASALCSKALDPIDESHITIAKPASVSADSYLAFKAAYRKEMGPNRPKEALIRQFESVLNSLHSTQMSKSEILFPQMEAYIQSPSEARWQEIKWAARKLALEIQDAVNASIAFDAQLYQTGSQIILVANGTSEVVDRSFNQSFQDSRSQWSGNGFVLRQINQFENRPTVEQMRNWAVELQSRYSVLEAEMARLLQMIRQRA